MKIKKKDAPRPSTIATMGKNQDDRTAPLHTYHDHRYHCSLWGVQMTNGTGVGPASANIQAPHFHRIKRHIALIVFLYASYPAACPCRYYDHGRFAFWRECFNNQSCFSIAATREAVPYHSGISVATMSPADIQAGCFCRVRIQPVADFAVNSHSCH